MAEIKPRKDGMGWYYEDKETTALPSYSETITEMPSNASYGWVCPKCGRVNAPWASVCPCYLGETVTIKLTSTECK